MSNELTTTQQPPFGPNSQSRALAMPSSVNAGAVAIEQERAVAEAKGQMQLAKMFPRDLNAVYAELMEACKLPAMANVAFYSVPQGGSKVTGPSIRLAEQIAACVGNFEFGHRELSRVEATATNFGRSEIEVYAWDKEKNNRSIRQITVLHVLDTKDGPRRLRDQKDIDNKIANVASKQARGRILALLPKWLVEAAVEECKKTLAGNNDQPLSVRVRAMTQAFAKFGVTTEHLEKHLGHSLDGVLADELVDLMGVYSALKEGVSPSEFFGENQVDDGKQAAASLQQSAQAGAAAAPEAAAPAATPRPTARPTRAAAQKPAQAEAPAATATPASAAPEVSKESQNNGSPVQDQAAPQAAQAAQPEPQQQQSAPAGTDPEDIF